MSWLDSLHADTVRPYLIRNRGENGVRITLRARVLTGSPVDRMRVRAFIDGIDHHFPMVKRSSGKVFDWYESTFDLRQDRTHYSLIVHDLTGNTWYYNRAGVHSVFPNDDHDFTISANTVAPEWVSSAVFYQIFPDRFHRSGRLPEVRPGEIRRDGFESRQMNWNDRPLPYHEGGSLDFFGGDLYGVEEKLDYLEQIGVSALYLTPVFLAKTNHRYDCLDYFTVDPRVGGDEALISLVRAAHGRGMRVVLDVSINHVAREHAWAKEDAVIRDAIVRDSGGEYVRWAGVPELLKLDYSSEQLRNRIYRDEDSVVQRYLRPPFEIDGWRFDVASETGRYGPAQHGDEVWREIRRAIRSVNPDAYIVGELWHDSHHYLAGDMWDSAMNYFASGRIARMWTGEQDRFAAHPVREAAGGRRISGVEAGQLLEQHFCRIPNELVHAQFNLLDSHDVTRLHNNHDVFEWSLYEGLIMLLFLLPGTFSVYYGDEVGLDGDLTGDHGKRYPMVWDRTTWDGRFVELYRSMMWLKRNEEALHTGSGRVLDADDEHLVYARFSDSRYAAVVLNRGTTEHSYSFDISAVGATEVTVMGGAGWTSLDGFTLSVDLHAHRSVLIGGAIDDNGAPEA